MRTQGLLISFATHFALGLAALALASLSKVATLEVPIEVSQILEASHPTSAKPRIATARKSVAKPAPLQSSEQSSEPPSSSEAKASAASPDQGLPAGENLAEEYEVTSLPVPLNEVRVPFPEAAKARHAQGAVVFLLTISSTGSVVQANLIGDADPALSSAAHSALLRFKFKPAVLRDKPVAIQIRYTYRFVLQ